MASSSSSTSLTKRDDVILRVGKAKITRKVKELNRDLLNVKAKIGRLAREKKFAEITEEEKRMQKLGRQLISYNRLIEALEDRTSCLDLSSMTNVLNKINQSASASSIDGAIAQFIQQSATSSSPFDRDDYDIDRLPVKLVDCMSDVDYQEYEREREQHRRVILPASGLLIDF